MARVPLPERGQPLDVSYIYSLAQAINDVAVAVNSGSNNESTISSPGMPAQTVRTSETRFVASTQQVVSGEDAKAGDIKDYSFDFGSSFKYIPVVTITTVNVGQNTPGSNVNVTIREVTTSKVVYDVRYNATGNVSLSVNIMAIGLPN